MKNENEYYEVIGKLSVNFQRIELILTSLIGRIICSEKHIGSIITSQLSFRKLCDLCGALYKYRINDKTKLSKLDEILKKLDMIAEERNTIIHSLLAQNFEKDCATFIKFKASRKKGFHVDYKAADLNELNLLIDSMSDIYEELVQLYLEAHQILPYADRWK